jgi:hypothetical protein
MHREPIRLISGNSPFCETFFTDVRVPVERTWRNAVPSTAMKSTTVTMLRYSDAEVAIAWLCKAFGFETFLVVKGEAEPVTHARLILENSMVMLASIGRAGVYEQRFRLPACSPHDRAVSPAWSVDVKYLLRSGSRNARRGP